MANIGIRDHIYTPPAPEDPPEVPIWEIHEDEDAQSSEQGEAEECSARLQCHTSKAHVIWFTDALEHV